MQAIASSSYGPVDQLKPTELPLPEPGDPEVRVKVHFSSVNPADYKVTTGTMKILHGRVFPMVVGYDFSGVVDKVGAGVTAVAVGDEVFGFLPYSGATRQGAYAEYVVCAATGLAKKPAGVTHRTAAAAATGGITTLQSLRDLGRLASGGHVLIVGAAGGVGAVGVGVARKLGARVTAVCSTHAVDFVTGLGADEVIDRKKQDPLTTATGPFDVVFDAAAAHSWGATRHLLKPGGTYVSTLPSAALFAHIVFSLVTATRVRFVMVKPVADDLVLLGRWLVEGLTVPVESTVPVRGVAAAMQRMMAGEVRGRIAVDVIGGF
jgi:NADPH:quinone reductase